MNRIFKLFVLGTVLAYVGARLRRRTAAGAHTEATPPIGVSPSSGADLPAFSGISDVDPEPLTQFGEAIDPDAIRDAHAEPALLREQLPQPGKNLP
ncbi:MAG: hypothetical protein H0T42_27610 [Deltaproteobacteria bacterium]|nr:hypothetical protein [Deltaproteobacteria bacterium]